MPLLSVLFIFIVFRPLPSGLEQQSNRAVEGDIHES
jgi:hypothetical protein